MDGRELVYGWKGAHIWMEGSSYMDVRELIFGDLDVRELIYGWKGAHIWM